MPRLLIIMNCDSRPITAKLNHSRILSWDVWRLFSLFTAQATIFHGVLVPSWMACVSCVMPVTRESHGRFCESGTRCFVLLATALRGPVRVARGGFVELFRRVPPLVSDSRLPGNDARVPVSDPRNGHNHNTDHHGPPVVCLPSCFFNLQVPTGCP